MIIFSIVFILEEKNKMYDEKLLRNENSFINFHYGMSSTIFVSHGEDWVLLLSSRSFFFLFREYFSYEAIWVHLNFTSYIIRNDLFNFSFTNNKRIHSSHSQITGQLIFYEHTNLQYANSDLLERCTDLVRNLRVIFS